MGHQIRIVDVFTDVQLAGNQLAVVLDGEGLSTAHMQKIAREMNFSETTFILPPDDPDSAARVRIFTPLSELPFAGHPTIGTAWVMLDEGMVDGLEFTLEEGVGPVQVRGERTGHRVRFWMRHPQVEFGDVFAHEQVAKALGVPRSEFIDEIPSQVAWTGYPVLFAALRSKDAVDQAVSNRVRLAELFEGRGVDIVYFFAAAGRNHLYSRMFSLDIVEDPATGGAGGPLGAFAVRYGVIDRAANVALVSEQGTKIGRQSFIHIGLTYGDAPELPERIEVGGDVMPVLKGTLADLSR